MIVRKKIVDAFKVILKAILISFCLLLLGSPAAVVVASKDKIQITSLDFAVALIVKNCCVWGIIIAIVIIIVVIIYIIGAVFFEDPPGGNSIKDP